MSVSLSSVITRNTTLSEHARHALLPIIQEDLHIRPEDETDNKKILEDINMSAERLLGNIAKEGSEDDILSNQKLLSLAEETIRLYVLYKYKRRLNNDLAAKDYKEEYLATKEALQNKLHVARTSVSRRHFAVTTYEQDLVPVHGQDFGLGDVLI